MLTIAPIPAFSDNYIWVISQEGDDNVAVVDPGDAQVVENYLATHKYSLSAILITHHHNDHTGGVATLAANRDIPIYGPANSPFRGISNPLGNDDVINLFDHAFHVHEIPGHTLDHISYFIEGEPSQLFCGDTLFLAGCGRLFEGSPQQMLQAMQYFTNLPSDTDIYCTHEYSLANLAFARAVEPKNQDIRLATERCMALRENNKPTLPTSLCEEKKINPFLRTSQQEVIQAAKHFKAQLLSSEVDIFAAIREWKNQF